MVELHHTLSRISRRVSRFIGQRRPRLSPDEVDERQAFLEVRSGFGPSIVTAIDRQ